MLVFLGLAVFVASETVLFGFLSSEPTAVPIVGAVAAAALVPATPVAVYVWVSDPGDGVSASVLTAGFFLGMVATFLAAALNGAAAERLHWLPVYAFPVLFYASVGPIEESLKMLAVSLHPATDRRLDSAIEYAAVGAFVGLGFAFVENAFYLDTGVVLAGNTEAMAETAMTRASVGPLHVVLTALAGYYAGRAVLSSSGYGHRVLLAAKGLVGVALLHGTYNAVVSRSTVEGNLAARGPVGAGVIDGQAVTPVFIAVFFAFVLYLLVRVMREGRQRS